MAVHQCQKKGVWKVALLLSTLFAYATTQHLFNCPSSWYQHKEECYLFEGDFPKTYENARIACSDHGAALVSVPDVSVHNFIKNWLDGNDPFLRSWYTSGTRERVTVLLEKSPGFMWESTGEKVDTVSNFWLPGTDRNDSSGVIVYELGDAGYGWGLVNPGTELPYICEVARAEAYRIVQNDRDYDYGFNVLDPNVLLRGPHFTHQPVSKVVVGGPELAEFECVAAANPPPTYRWYRGKNFEQEVTSDLDSRYTLTNGKLIIQNPREVLDANKYRCTAENQLGVILSNEVELTFGSLGEFSNVPDAAVNARAYDGVAIECSKITYKPAVKYNWFKESVSSFIRSTFQTYQFMSQNGKLYFSEVTRADEGRYHCIAILTGVNRYTIGTKQPPTRTSLAIPLFVHDQAPKADWGPEIQDDFIAVFPQPPLKGQDVRLECFAYGSSTTPFHYSWVREGKPMPERAFLSDHNRVLTILDARLEDQGVYTCHVSRSSNARDSKSFQLSLGARPYFISKLRDQHVDINSQLTWRCDARANPPASYTWYKNGKVVTSDPNKGFQVKANVLRISKLDPKLHDGMYQCGAVNVYGMTLSEGQLRVLAFAPTFEKHPLISQIQAAERGNVTITCNPEGAPTPVIEWYKNNLLLGTEGGRVVQLPNGNLVIQNVIGSDQGRYTCKATNEFGEASSSTVLTMAKGTAITVRPQNTRVIVNSTAFLSCQASYDPSMDLVYTWYFNGRLLDIDHRPDLRKVSRGPGGTNGLYVLGVDFMHAGYYECVARTTLNHDRRGAYLTVVGPPSEPTGCYVDDSSVVNGSVEVVWTPGAENGRPISRFVVEMANYFEKDEWVSVFSDMPHRIATEPISNEKKRVRISNLSPGNGYRFRVVAVNEYGPGLPSVPSTWIYMPSAPPKIPPHDVGGGGGSVGDLTITWVPLEPWEESGEGIGYIVYWRRYGEDNALFEAKELHGFHDHYVAFVGAHNYFLEYEVKVQAFNNQGMGPNSTAVVIFSAEDLPPLAVTDVRGDAYNGTANMATWTQIPSTREMARGIILGYQINYWLQRNIATDLKEFIRVEGHVSEGIFIGLESDTNYICEVRAYNSAGLGPRSETYLIETLHAPAHHYPEEVRVYSAGDNQVLVWWRGIHTGQPEENVHGWVMYFWPANEHYRSACEMLIHDHHAHETHITVDPGVVYALRVGAWSTGGYGKKTPTTYFTVEGQVTLDAAFAKEIDVFLASATVPSLQLLLLCACLVLTTWLH